MVVVTSQNIIFKMSDFSALLFLLQLVTMESQMHSEIRRLCPNKGSPAMQGFTCTESPCTGTSCFQRRKIGE